MHRRVTQTAAVVPRAFSSEDSARVVAEATSYYGPDVFIPRLESADIGYDVHDEDEDEQHHWRRLDSRGESILSGLDGPGEEEDRMRRSPESLSRVAEEDPDPPPTVGQLEPEDVQEAIEWELEEHGLYRGSYGRLLALYAFVPASAVLTLVVFALLPCLVWPHPVAPPSRYPPLFPPPLPELVLSSAMFALTHQLRVPIHALSSLLLRPAIASPLSVLLHVLLVNLFRLASLALLQIRHDMGLGSPAWWDPSFHTVWWLALNVAEVATALVQGYQHITPYRDVMVPPGREREFLERLKNDGRQIQNGNVSAHGSRDDLELQRPPTAHDVDRLLASKEREELEAVYGIAPIRIPVFVSCLQRFDAVLLSLGLTLLLSSAYLRSPLSVPAGDPNFGSSHRPLAITFPIVVVVHACLLSMYTPTVLPRIGIHTAAYVSVLVSLLALFAGLAVWEALS